MTAGDIRHMTKGQRAMSFTLNNPETQQGKKLTSLKISEVSSAYVRMARAVIEYGPSDLVPAVRDGAMALAADG